MARVRISLTLASDGGASGDSGPRWSFMALQLFEPTELGRTPSSRRRNPPQREASPEEIEELLRISIEGRKRVKDQIVRIDSTMAEVKFGYLDKAGNWHDVTTLEEQEHPAYYHRRAADGGDVDGPDPSANANTTEPETDTSPTEEKHGRIFEGHKEFTPGRMPCWSKK